MAKVRELVLTIHLPDYTQSLSVNLRAGDRNWNLSLAWDFYRWGRRYLFPVRITPYFRYEPNMTVIDAAWNNRHNECCGWGQQSHCGRFEGA